MQNTPLPEAFKESLQAHLGANKATNLIQSLNGSPSTSLRLNTQKFAGVKLDIESVPWTKSGYWLTERPLFISDPLWHAGYYYVQEASSMALEAAYNKMIEIGLSDSPLILDACAAPGGKSTHLLDLMAGNGLLISHDYLPKRAGILAENIRRWGANNSIVTQGELDGFAQSGLEFDAIVLDAPCSGEGMFRKDMNARKEWSEENVSSCVNRQKKLISDLWPNIKNEGFLLYSTCTFNSEENEKQLQDLVQNGEAEVISLPLEQYGFELDGSSIGYHAYPDNVKGEGFYLALIRKKQSFTADIFRSFKSVNNPLMNTISFLGSFSIDTLFTVSSDDSSTFMSMADATHIVPKSTQFQNVLKCLSNNVQLKQIGLPIASLDTKRKVIVPEVSMAWSPSVIFDSPTLALTQVNIVKNLRGEAVHHAFEKGYTNLKYGRYSVSFAKSIGSRLNSLQPKNLRIKKNIEQSSLFSIFELLS